MADENWPQWLTRPAGYLGNFGGYVEQVEKDLENHFGDDPGVFETVQERAEARAPFFAAQAWLVERWGEHYPCPACQNIEWMVSEIGPASRPAGFLSFVVTCGYCGNTMEVVPGRAVQSAPVYGPTQLNLADQ